MECNGICNDDNGVYFKITCPGPYNNVPHKLRISKDGSSNVKYNDICEQQQHNARIAYINDPNYFEVDNNGQMVENTGTPVIGVSNRIPSDYEVLGRGPKKGTRIDSI